jgi:hypothetical protein
MALPNSATLLSVNAVCTTSFKVLSCVAVLLTVPTTKPAAMIAALAVDFVAFCAIKGLVALLEPARTAYWNCHN